MRYTNQRIRFVDDHKDMHQILADDGEIGHAVVDS